MGTLHTVLPGELYILWRPALAMLPKDRKKVSVRAKPTSYPHLTYLYVEALTPINSRCTSICSC